MSYHRQDSDARQTARQHTAQLKKMLQGKASASNAEVDHPPGHPQAVRPPRQRDSLASRDHTTPDPATPLKSSSPPKRNPLAAATDHLRQPGSRVAKLVRQTKRLSELNRIFQAFLPSYLHAHAFLAKLDEESWVVQTDSSAWATRLRYLLPNLRRPLGEHLGMPIPPARIRIAPPAVPLPPPAPARRMHITESTAQLLEGAARDLPDRKLSAVMLRLAAHARQRNQPS